MSMTDSEIRSAKNKKIVASLCEAFAPLAERLTVEVEPATIYVISTQAPEPPADAPEDS